MSKVFISLIMMVSSTVLAINDNYKKQMKIVLEGDASGYTFAVPDEVYANSFVPDLRDMRIINSTGDYVPMRIFFAESEIIHEYSKTTLPLFKLNKTILKSVESKQTRTTLAGTKEDYRVTTSKSLENFLETLEVEDPNQIIIDATVVKGQKIEQLEVLWKFKTQGNRVFNVEILASNDLSHWKSINKRQQLVEINTGSRTLLENKIVLNHQAYSYYKITFTKGITPEITQVNAWLHNQTFKSNQQTKLVGYAAGKDNTLRLTTGGAYTLNSFTFSFDQENTITDLELYSRDNQNKKFETQGTIYSMTSNGVTVKSNKIELNHANKSLWHIQFDENINVKSVNKIEMNWSRHQVEFLAQGKAPFTLVYSNPRVHSLDTVSNSWYDKIPKDLRSKMFSSKVTLKQSKRAPIKTISHAVNKTVASNDYAKWIFWFVLTIVLMFLLVMAYKLIDETSGN